MKKVLIITYYWPPAGGPGVQRVLKFSKYFSKYGYEPIILTVKNPTSPSIDKSLLDEIPSDIRIIKTRAIEPFGIYKKIKKMDSSSGIPKDILKSDSNKFIDKLSKYIRANFFIPDARIGWLPFFVYNAIKIISKEKIDIMFTSSPPHSLQIGGLLIKLLTNIKWVSDFRDPWIGAYWLKSLKKNFISMNIDKFMEKQVLKKSDFVTTVSEELVNRFRSKVKNNFRVIHTGYEQYENYEVDDDYFNIVYFGNLTVEASCEELFEAINLMPEDIGSKIKIEIIGNVFPKFFEQIPKLKYAKMIVKNFMPRKELFSYVQKANLFFNVLLKNTDYSSGIIGAKTFDYLALRRPILLLGEKGGIAERVLEYTKSGKLFYYDDIDGIKNYIEQLYISWKKNKNSLLAENSNLKEFQSDYNVLKLSEIFNSII